MKKNCITVASQDLGTWVRHQKISDKLFYRSQEGGKEFCIKATDESSQDHGMNDVSEGRIVIVYGKVTESGIGLCISNLGWGEFPVLPSKYEVLLEE